MKMQVLVGLWTLLLSASASAVPVLNVSGGTAFYLDGVATSVGWAFNAANAFTVDALGFYDVGQDGLVNSHSVGIFDSTGNLLVSTLVDTSSTLLDGFRYAAVSPVELSAGSYTIAATFAVNEADLWLQNTSTPVMRSGFTYLGGRGGNSTTLAYPTIPVSGLDPGLFGPNFSVVPVPELSVIGARLPLAMVWMGLLALGGRRRR